MKVYSLKATNASDDTQGDSLAVSFGTKSSDSFVSIQRYRDGKSIYIVFDDQANGDYDKIASVLLSNSEIDIKLCGPVGHYETYSRILISLQISAEQSAAIADRMQQIFAESGVTFSRSF